jgi:hypothetical protein
LSRRDRQRTGERGQALLELALITPILILLIMAIFQFAYVIESQMGLTNAVREAGRRVAAQTDVAPNWVALETWVQGELCGDATPPCDGGLLPANVSGFDPSLLTTDPPTVTFCSYAVTGAAGTITNYQVNVSLTYQHPIFFALLDFATDALDGTPNNRWDLSVAAQMRLEYIDDQEPGFTAPAGPNPCPIT